MKRAITLSVGALVLSLFLASTALADSKCFSTGPLENAAGNASTTFWVKVLNNNGDDVDVKIVTFDLNGEKELHSKDSLTVAPLASEFIVIELDAAEFEVQVKVDNGDADKDHITVLISGFGKDAEGNLVAAHRLVYSEWTKIDCTTFGKIPGPAPADG